MFEIEGKKKKNGAFYENDYKKMAEEGFQFAGWKSYEESPYKEYQKRMELINANENITGND